MVVKFTYTLWEFSEWKLVIWCTKKSLLVYNFLIHFVMFWLKFVLSLCSNIALHQISATALIYFFWFWVSLRWYHISEVKQYGKHLVKFLWLPYFHIEYDCLFVCQTGKPSWLFPACWELIITILTHKHEKNKIFWKSQVIFQNSYFIYNKDKLNVPSLTTTRKYA